MALVPEAILEKLEPMQVITTYMYVHYSAGVELAVLYGNTFSSFFVNTFTSVLNHNASTCTCYTQYHRTV